MLLALDVENSNIVIGCFREEELCLVSRIAADRKKTADEYAVSLRNLLLMHEISPKEIDGSIVSSVVPDLINVIKDALLKLLGVPPLVVGPGVKSGLNIQMENPSALGSDFVVIAAAALSSHPAPLIVIRMETATTFAAIDSGNRYVGSVIAPGLRITVNALAASCDQLPRIALEPPQEVIGRNTVECMKSGAVIGTAAMIDGMISRMEETLGPCTVIATGCYADVVLPQCRREIIHEPNLSLLGLRRIYERNIRQRHRGN